MAIGTMVRGQFPKLLALGLHKIYNDANDTEQRAQEFDKVFNIEKSTDAYEQDTKMNAYGPLVEKPENTPITYTGMSQAGDKRYFHLTYGLGVRVSKELWDDDKYGVIKKAPKALARSIRFTKETVAWNTLNQGFSNNVTTVTGVSLFNSQQPLGGGSAATNIGPGLGNVIYAAGTYPNRPSVDVDLSFTAIQLATNQFERLVDAQGMPIAIRPKMIIIPQNLSLSLVKFLALLASLVPRIMISTAFSEKTSPLWFVIICIHRVLGLCSRISLITV